MDDWIRREAESLRALLGRTVTQWTCVEMALREAGPNGLPEWCDESIPALQLNRLDLILTGGPVASIIALQNDYGWSLCRRDDLPPSKLPSGAPESIFR